MGTQVFCVIGWPVHHSASPAMMNAVFAEENLDARYVPFAVRPEGLRDAVAGMKALGIRGVNVTVPHKQAIIPMMDGLTEVAQFAGAVNLVRIDGESGYIEGNNSDIIGWYRSLEDQFEDKQPKTVCLLGAGGGARGIVTALALYAPHVRVTLAARRPEQTREFVDAFGNRIDIEPVGWDDRLTAVEQANVVINATPIGMWPNAGDSPVGDGACFHAGQVVQDIIYRPLKTKFLEQAEARGASIRDGLWMLVYQGVVSVEYWLGLTPSADTMRQAALRHIQAQ